MEVKPQTVGAPEGDWYLCCTCCMHEPWPVTPNSGQTNVCCLMNPTPSSPIKAPTTRDEAMET